MGKIDKPGARGYDKILGKVPASGGQQEGSTLMKLKTVIFDLDGTLLDSLEGLWHSTNAALRALGYPERTLDEVRDFVGNGVGKLIERALPGGTENPEFERCVAEFLKDYQNTMLTCSRPYPGIVPLLEGLRADGYATAVVSNKVDGAVKELSRKFFGELIRVSIGERSGVARKPAPDSVFAALEELGMPRESAAYVGDSEVDIATARNAGLPCFSVDWGNRTRQLLLSSGATSISHTAEELAEKIRAYV